MYSHDDLPVGLGMALAQNVGALRCFGELNLEEQLKIIERAKCANSREDMAAIVDSISK